MSASGWWPFGEDAVPPDERARKAWERADRRFDAQVEQRPWTTWALVVVLVVLHLAVGLDSRPRQAWWVKLGWPRPEPALVRWGAIDPGRIADGEAWRLVSYGFLHTDWLHLGLNALALWGLGRVVEAVFGPVRALWLFVVSVVGGGLLSLVGGGTVLVGASGGVFGLLGALVAFGLRRQSALSTSVREVFGWKLWPWILLNLLIGLALPFVNDKAHVGGLVAGALASLPLGDRITDATPRRPVSVALLVVLTVALAWAEGMVDVRG
ncbi:MAG: rhomboid family intramembrane serine protease [Myxococcota bacterium]